VRPAADIVDVAVSVLLFDVWQTSKPNLKLGYPESHSRVMSDTLPQCSRSLAILKRC